MSKAADAHCVLIKNKEQPLGSNFIEAMELDFINEYRAEIYNAVKFLAEIEEAQEGTSTPFTFEELDRE